MNKNVLGVFLLIYLHGISATEFIEIPKNLTALAYDISKEEREGLKVQLAIASPTHLQACIEETQKCKVLYPFAPQQLIFSWCLASEVLQTKTSVQSFIPSLANVFSYKLEPITAALQSLPAFFSRDAFNEVNSGYLEGGTPLLQKWINVAATCAAVKSETDLIVDTTERFEVASHLMLFMQHRSIDLIPYYAEALLNDPKLIEDNYYPLYCLSRRLKGHGELQDMLLRRLALYGNEGRFNIVFSLSKKLLWNIQRRGFVGYTAANFIKSMIKSETPCQELLALQYASH